MQPLQLGTIIAGKYRVERLLASGGMADVYLLAHRTLPRSFALKVLRSSSEPSDLLERFRREGQILASLRHAHVVDVYDCDVTEAGMPYLIMELLEGEELAHFLARTGPLQLSVALHICAQIGEALSAAHRMGVVHRDLKPSNIFLCNKGPFPNFVKVLDFGIAKLTAGSTSSLTNQSVIMGTPGYMAPEQAIGDIEHIDHRADQFALAAILYEMLVGQAPFHRRGELPGTILERVMYATPQPMSGHAPHINDAIRKALSKDPAARYPDIRMFLAAVGAISHTIYLPSAATGPHSSGSLGPAEAVEKRRRPLGRSLALALGCCAGLAALAWRFAGERPVAAVHPAPVQKPAAPLPTASPQSAPLTNAAPGAAPPQPASALLPTPAAAVPLHPPTIAAAIQAPAAARLANSSLRPARTASHRPATQPGLGFKVQLQDDSVANSQLRAWQEGQIQHCADIHLRPLVTGLQAGTTIVLFRLSTLKVQAAPEVVSSSGLGYCLERAFSNFKQTPGKALIRVQ